MDTALDINDEACCTHTRHIWKEKRHETWRGLGLVTCSPFPLWPPLAGLFWLGFLWFLPSFIIVVAPSVFIFFLSKVIVLLIAAKVICRIDTEGIQAVTLPAPPNKSTGTTFSSPPLRLTCWIIFGFGQLVIRLLAATWDGGRTRVNALIAFDWVAQGVGGAHLSSCEFFERLCLGSRGAVRTFFGSLSPYSSSSKKQPCSQPPRSQLHLLQPQLHL